MMGVFESGLNLEIAEDLSLSKVVSKLNKAAIGYQRIVDIVL